MLVPRASLRACACFSDSAAPVFDQQEAQKGEMLLLHFFFFLFFFHGAMFEFFFKMGCWDIVALEMICRGKSLCLVAGRQE